MLGGKRADRIGELVKEELGRLILMRVKDPRMGFVTITHVKMSADLRHARVMYSVMAKDTVADRTSEALESARGFLQHEIANRLKLRLTPVLKFDLDTSLDQSLKIDAIIKKLHEGL